MRRRQRSRTSNGALFAVPVKLAPPPCDPVTHTEADVERIARGLEAEHGDHPPYTWHTMLLRRGLVGPCAERIAARLEGRA